MKIDTLTRTTPDFSDMPRYSRPIFLGRIAGNLFLASWEEEFKPATHEKKAEKIIVVTTIAGNEEFIPEEKDYKNYKKIVFEKNALGINITMPTGGLFFLPFDESKRPWLGNISIKDVCKRKPEPILELLKTRSS